MSEYLLFLGSIHVPMVGTSCPHPPYQLLHVCSRPAAPSRLYMYFGTLSSLPLERQISIIIAGRATFLCVCLTTSMYMQSSEGHVILAVGTYRPEEQQWKVGLQVWEIVRR